VSIDHAAASWLYANFLKLLAMGPKESDHDSIPAEAKEMERDKSQFTVKLVVLVNAFLFSTCFFMDNSVFPVSIFRECIFIVFVNTPNGRFSRLQKFKLLCIAPQRSLHTLQCVSGRP